MSDEPIQHEANDEAHLIAERKMQFLYALRSKGVTDKSVLSAMEAVDRGPFIRGLFATRAYEAWNRQNWDTEHDYIGICRRLLRLIEHLVNRRC